MFGEREAKKFLDTEMQRYAQIQHKEYERWLRAPGFDYDVLVSDPTKLFWWMIKQPGYLKPIYDRAKSRMYRSSTHNSLPAEKINSIVSDITGGTNEVLAYFVGTAETILDKEREDELLFNKRNSAKLIEADAHYTIQHRPTVPTQINGKTIGGFSPDLIRISLSKRRAISVIENSIDSGGVTINDAAATHESQINYQGKKLGNLAIAKKHHPLLFPANTFVELGLPADANIDAEVEGIEAVYWKYPLAAARELSTRFYHEFRPHNQPTLAELIPQLRTHHLLGGENHRRSSAIFVPGYTRA